MGTKWRTENTSTVATDWSGHCTPGHGYCSTAVMCCDNSAVVPVVLRVHTVCHTAIHASDTDPSISQLQRSFVCPMMYWPQLLPLPLFSNLIHWCSNWSSTSASSQFSLVPQFLPVKPMMDRLYAVPAFIVIYTYRKNKYCLVVKFSYSEYSNFNRLFRKIDYQN